MESGSPSCRAPIGGEWTRASRTWPSRPTVTQALRFRWSGLRPMPSTSSDNISSLGDSASATVFPAGTTTANDTIPALSDSANALVTSGNVHTAPDLLITTAIQWPVLATSPTVAQETEEHPSIVYKSFDVFTLAHYG